MGLITVFMLMACVDQENPVETEAKSKVALNAASKKIIGKWKFVRTQYGSSDENGKETTFEFDAGGNVTYDGFITYGSDSEHKESAYSFENDWKYTEEGLTGHVYFLLWRSLPQYDGKSRVGCLFTNDEMCIWDDNYPDAKPIMAPTVYYFKRIE